MEPLESFDHRVRSKFGTGMAGIPDAPSAISDQACLVMAGPYGEIWVDEPRMDDEGTVTFWDVFVVNRDDEAPPCTHIGKIHRLTLRHEPHYDKRHRCRRAVVRRYGM